jgi:hypothetical protein
MKIVNGIELDDGVDEPDSCRECGTWMMGCGYAPLCGSCCESQNVTEHDFEQWDADRERAKQEHYAAKEAMTDDELGI